MSIALITGASAGLGQVMTKFAPEFFPEIDEYWLVARRLEKLEAAASFLKGKKVRLLSYDLCEYSSFDQLSKLLKEEKPEIGLLINNAGCGYLNNVGDGPLSDQTRMIDLNVRAATAVTHIVIPYIKNGGRIINISSIASFCPNPRMSVYSSTKAYMSSFSRGIRYELRGRDIKVTAVCPGPMDTAFLDIGNINGNSATFDKLPHCNVEKVAKGALRASKKGSAFYTPGAFYKFYRFLAKILPHCLVVRLSKT